MSGGGKLADILEVHALARDRRKGVLHCGSITVPCALGRSGVIVRKKEGDGATPAGSFELMHIYYRMDRGPRPRTLLPMEAITPDLGWCDDPAYARYNRPVKLPFSLSHEKMWRDDRLYDIVVVLDCNMYPPVKGQGSAIFFHIAREDYRPTEGCVAIAPDHMRLLLSVIGPGAVMTIRP
ncbi:L,D-transpeptidase family protein [Roseibium denhamense]|uniref:L,D-peptidoglycan transpeptidase YkuD, ErfK/YbiS/YcfS/YnhG family n=1 Tax=Roseibium denhamense TaxID=76305 RepID=A0ABY1PAB5_9HYPH|nr:L,D-transpeptidase family protein [Roseibium denhamense]SMP30037.1 L,D-peptidoglycan transpeptidase YkuD, ErfK/YbiS/YcfS/YnhG family [Roseibium denhamense]